MPRGDIFDESYSLSKLIMLLTFPYRFIYELLTNRILNILVIIPSSQIIEYLIHVLFVFLNEFERLQHFYYLILFLLGALGAQSIKHSVSLVPFDLQRQGHLLFVVGTGVNILFLLLRGHF